MASQQGIRAGKAFVELYANDTKLVRGLRLAQRKLQRFGSMITSIGARIASTATIAAAPFGFAIKAASNMEETMNKFNVVFGDNSKSVKEWSDSFASDVGRSEQQVADFMAGTQDLFVPLGFEPGAATEMSKQITGLAVDLASFNNMSDAAVIRDLHAALTGSGEVMKKYGVLVSEAAVKQELLNTGMDPKTATDQQKVMARLSIIMRGTTAAQGDAIRSAGSFANQMKRLKAVISDAAVDLGNAYLPVVTQAVKSAADAVKIAGKWIEQNSGLVKSIVILTAIIGAAGVAMIALGTSISLVGSLIGAILSPLGATVAALALLVTWVMKSGVAMEWLGSTFGPLFEQFNDAIGAIKEALTNGNLSAAANVAFAALELAWVKGTNKIKNIWRDALLGMKIAWSDIVGGLANTMLRITGNAEAVQESDQITKQRNDRFRKENDAAKKKAEADLKEAELAYKNAKEEAKKPSKETSSLDKLQAGLAGAGVSANVGAGIMSPVKSGSGISGTFSALSQLMYGSSQGQISPDGKAIVKAIDKQTEEYKQAFEMQGLA